MTQAMENATTEQQIASTSSLVGAHPPETTNDQNYAELSEKTFFKLRRWVEKLSVADCVSIYHLNSQPEIEAVSKKFLLMLRRLKNAIESEWIEEESLETPLQPVEHRSDYSDENSKHSANTTTATSPLNTCSANLAANNLSSTHLFSNSSQITTTALSSTREKRTSHHHALYDPLVMDHSVLRMPTDAAGRQRDLLPKFSVHYLPEVGGAGDVALLRRCMYCGVSIWSRGWQCLQTMASGSASASLMLKNEVTGEGMDEEEEEEVVENDTAHNSPKISSTTPGGTLNAHTHTGVHNLCNFCYVGTLRCNARHTMVMVERVKMKEMMEVYRKSINTYNSILYPQQKQFNCIMQSTFDAQLLNSSGEVFDAYMQRFLSSTSPSYFCISSDPRPAEGRNACTISYHLTLRSLYNFPDVYCHQCKSKRLPCEMVTCSNTVHVQSFSKGFFFLVIFHSKYFPCHFFIESINFFLFSYYWCCPLKFSTSLPPPQISTILTQL